MNNIPFFPQKYFSHLLIVGMVLVSLIGFSYPNFQTLFGFHTGMYAIQNIPQIITQIVLFQFLHADALHLVMNSVFLYQAGPEIESRMSPKRFKLFFIATTIFIALCLTVFSRYTITIGMSGFCMALLSYLWIDLYTIRHPLANQTLVMLVINILIGFTGNISLTAHASGAVIGFLWWKGRKKFLR